MELLAHGPAAWPLTCLVLLALLGCPGVGAQQSQSFQLQQPQDKVSVTAGETFTLTCTTDGYGPPGPVQWLKGWGSENKTIYDDQTGSFPRVTRVVDGSNSDFSIHIRDVQPEDAGTYYCVKFRRVPGRGLEVFEHGRGTEVSVYAKPSQPLVSGPRHRAMPRQSVPFNCTSGGFFPRDIRVRWLKDEAPVSAQQPQISPGRGQSFELWSRVTLTLQEADVRSQLLCEVQHPTLPAPLRGTYPLRHALRVPPRVRVFTEPLGSVELNKTVNIICLLEGFYPGDVAVTWLENRTEMKVENISQPEETPEGLFKLRSLLEVQAVEQKNGSVFTCRAVHDGQEPVSRMLTLWITVPTKEGQSNASSKDSGNLLPIYIVVGVVCTVLVLLVAAILYLIRVKQSKGKSSPSARLHEPEKSSEATTQESDPNNLTYADLNFERERKTIRRMVEMSQQSEYASIQTSQAPSSDDNLTYADLDMVHLNKAPKRPAPRPEEASSEYASVQIPRK